MSTARMVEDRVIKVGRAEMAQAILKLVTSADSGIGEGNLAEDFFRL